MKKTIFFGLLFIVVAFIFIKVYEFDVNENDDNSVVTTGKAFTEQDFLTVKYLDVGQADSTVFHLRDENKEYVILYDVGDWKGTEVIDYLDKQKINKIDLIIISHPHADHIGQLKQILEQYTVEEVWMTGNETNTNLYISTLETLLNSDTIYHEPEVGDRYDIGALQIDILHPKNITGDLNEDSLSILATFGERTFLFTGDAGKKTEKVLLEGKLKIAADFLQLGHHGSNTSSDLKFIQKVNPLHAIYSAGIGNSYGHPSPDVIALLKGENIPVLGTDLHGTITITTDGKDYEITTEKNLTREYSCIDLNNASASELTEIIHISDTRAKEIIQLRPLIKLEDLEKVNGIGPKRLADIIGENKACIEGE